MTIRYSLFFVIEQANITVCIPTAHKKAAPGLTFFLSVL